MEEYKMRYIQSCFEEVIDFLNNSLQHWDDKENTLEVEYKVINAGNETMYFGIGGHPAIKVDYENNDTKGNYLVFEEETDFDLIAERKAAREGLDKQELLDEWKFNNIKILYIFI